MKKVLSKLSVIFWLTPAFIAVAIYFILPHFPTAAEYIFTRGIFRVFSFVLGNISSIIPISIAEALILISPLLLILVIYLTVRKIKNSPHRRQTVFAFIKGVVFIISCILLMYMFMHGANFYRYSAAQLMGLDTSPKSAEYLYKVTCDLAVKASAERENCELDEDGYMTFSESIITTLSQVENGYEYLYDDYPFLEGTVKKAKPVLILSRAWSYTGFSGAYFAWMSEANINSDMPEFTIPACAAHEIAHTRGFARENECNFLAYLSSIHSDYADYRYSGYLLALRNCLNQLHGADLELFYDAYTYVSDGVYADIISLNEYLDQFDGEVNEAASAFNDTFIKVQGVPSGEKSYGEMVDLVLAYYQKEGIV